MKTKNNFLFLSAAFFLSLIGCDSIESDNKVILLKGPEENAVIDIMAQGERNFVDAMYEQETGISVDKKYCINDLNGDQVKIFDYYQPYTEGKGVGVKLEFEQSGFGKDKVYVIHLATKEDFSDDFKVLTKESFYNAHSLKSNTKYYWKVTNQDEDISSTVKTFSTILGWRGINAGYATNNIRDMGGHLVKGNKIIKQGLVYRGCELNPEAYESSGTSHNKTITPDTIWTFKNIMKVGTEIDLRGVAESYSITSSNLGWSVKYNRQSISGYGELVNDSTGKEAKKVKSIFKDILNAREDSSVYFHCMGGADRTGSIGFLLGGVLGMSYTDLIIDFELTSFSYNLRQHDVVAQYSDFPGLIAGLKEVTKTNEANPDIQTMCEKYLVNIVGLTSDEITSLKNLMLEDYHA